ncbi:HCP-like protein [Rhizophagus irregularis]|nr:HCP-like protein [Rhizophagus irregularis]
MEYADGGSLRCYLKKNFTKLSWDDKYKMAYQLSCAVSCLHNEGIVHCDLHSGNILVRNNTIKLADFGLSKRIGASSNVQSKLFGVVPYIDPKSFSKRRNNNNNNESTQAYSLNEKSDIYSVGVLLWEISSGQPPFYVEGEHYDISLALDILQGLRETVVPDTPDEYVKIYTKCWDGEPDNRPTIYQVVDWLNAKIAKIDIIIENRQISNEQEANLSTNNSELPGDLSQLIQNFDKMNTKEIDSHQITNELELNETSLSTNNSELQGDQNFDKMNTKEIDSISISSKQENHSIEKDFNVIIDEIIDFIYKLNNKGIERKLEKKQVIEYFNNHNLSSQEFYNWLLNNQNNSNSIFILGYFNYFGIVTSENDKETFNLFINASENNHTLAQYFVGLCYRHGYGTMKSEKLAFEYYKKVADKNLSNGQLNIGYYYDFGIGINEDLKKAFYWYKKAANNGNLIAKYNLGKCYEDGIGVKKDYNKAFELFKQSAEGGYLDGIVMLGYCYNNGIGTKIDKRKAFKLYKNAANLGDDVAQNNLAVIYRDGIGIARDVNKAIYWFEKSAKQGNEKAKNNLKRLRKNQ